MTKHEADRMLIERFEQLNEQAEKTENGTELSLLCDSAHKIYITLCNAGAFEGISGNGPSGGSNMHLQ